MAKPYSPKKALLNNRPTKTTMPACPACTEGKATFINSKLVIHEDGVCPKAPQAPHLQLTERQQAREKEMHKHD